MVWGVLAFYNFDRLQVLITAPSVDQDHFIALGLILLVMKKIVIDGRELRTSSGRYVERLLYYLQAIDQEHHYDVLLKPKDMNSWTPTNANFEKIACSYKEFGFGEQLGLLNQINQLDPDLVHFTFPQQPIWYQGETVTTIHDLTTLRYNNPSKLLPLFKF